jgi:ABC-type nitrate/sulfonate/bicarbonate transport system substrate-binding protein
LYFGVQRGLFAECGVSVELRDVRGARDQMQRFAVQREFQLVQTAFDNVLSLSLGRFEELPPTPARVFAGGDDGFLSLVARPQALLRGVARLRLGIDSPMSGYAFVAFQLLARLGWARTDYDVVSCGGGRERAQALREGRAEAIISYPPHDALLLQEGHEIVARGGQGLGMPYQGYVMAALQDWVDENGEALHTFRHAFETVMLQALAAEHRAACVDILAEALALEPRLAGRVYDDMLAQPHGFDRDAMPRPEAMEGTIALREQWGGQPVPLSPDVLTVPEAPTPPRPDGQ